MKKKYKEILTIIENNKRIKITKTSAYFVFKIGKEEWNDSYYQKKAHSVKCYDQESLKTHLKQVCSLNSIDYDSAQNQLNMALKSIIQVNVPSTDYYRVGYGGNSQYYDYILEHKQAGKENTKLYGLDIKQRRLSYS